MSNILSFISAPGAYLPGMGGGTAGIGQFGSYGNTYSGGYGYGTFGGFSDSGAFGRGTGQRSFNRVPQRAQTFDFAEITDPDNPIYDDEKQVQ